MTPNIAYGLVPLIGVLFTAWLWTSLSKTTFMVGGIWVAVGPLWLAFRTRMFTRRPPELRLSDVELESDELSPWRPCVLLARAGPKLSCCPTW